MMEAATQFHVILDFQNATPGHSQSVTKVPYLCYATFKDAVLRIAILRFCIGDFQSVIVGLSPRAGPLMLRQNDAILLEFSTGHA